MVLDQRRLCIERRTAGRRHTLDEGIRDDHGHILCIKLIYQPLQDLVLTHRETETGCLPAGSCRVRPKFLWFSYRIILPIRGVGRLNRLNMGGRRHSLMSMILSFADEWSPSPGSRPLVILVLTRFG